MVVEILSEVVSRRYFPVSDIINTPMMVTAINTKRQ